MQNLQNAFKLIYYLVLAAEREGKRLRGSPVHAMHAHTAMKETTGNAKEIELLSFFIFYLFYLFITVVILAL